MRISAEVGGEDMAKRKDPVKVVLLISFVTIMVLMFAMPTITGTDFGEGILANVMEYMPLILIIMLLIGGTLALKKGY